MGHIITVLNNKGGCGKTCVSVNLGTALARLKKKVLVIDFDPQSNASATLLPPTETNRKNTVYELIHPDIDTPELQKCVHPSPHQKNLYCLPNVKASSVLDMLMVPDYPKSLMCLRNAVKEHVEKEFDYTIIDTPPNIGMITSNALCTSHYGIVPIDVSSADSLDGLQEALDLIEATKRDHNPELKFFRLLINKMHKRRDICHALLEDINRDFPKELKFETVIPDNTALQKAVYARKTIYNYSKSCAGVRAFNLLSRELVKILE